MPHPAITTHLQIQPGVRAWPVPPAPTAQVDATTAAPADVLQHNAEEEQLRRTAKMGQLYLQGNLLDLQILEAKVEHDRQLFDAAASRLRASGTPTEEVATEAQMESLQAILDESEIDLTFDSHFDFYAEIVKQLERLKAEWLDPFGEVLNDYVAFFDKLTKAMSGLAEAIKGTDKDGNLIVDYDAVRRSLRDLYGGFSRQGNIPLGSPLDDPDEAKKLLEEMGSPPGLVITEVNGKFQIELDKGFIEAIRAVFPAGRQTISPAAQAALDAAKNAQMERLMHINRVIPDRYQRQVQSWETLVKILTGTIQSTSEADSNIARNWN